ncbi:MAG: 2'-5' RNA ligase family protein [Cyanobacteria bacterium P01_G01_bin.49]
MLSSKKRFFIALIPPQAVQEEAYKIQQYFSEVYNSHAALRSPPHITLQPPFDWDLDALPALVKELQIFSQFYSPIPIILDGFAAFKPRVIYINVVKTPELLNLQQALMIHAEAKLNIVHQPSKNRPFSPHLTVGFRDLTKPNFYRAWSEFQRKEIQFNFIAHKLTLLIHNGKMWENYQKFIFNS